MTDFAYINDDEERQRAEYDEIVINGISIPVASVSLTDLSRFESKITFGDYTKDSDQLLSTWVQSSWAGGLLLNSHTEGATDQRGRWACAWTMSSEQLALPPRHELLEFGTEIEHTDSDARGPISVPLIEVQGALYAAMGKELWKVTALPYAYSSVTTTKVGDLPGYAQGKAVTGATDETMWIPLGDDGIQVARSHVHPTNPDTIHTHIPDVHAISLEWWDGKVFALDKEGQLHICPLPHVSETFDPPSDLMRLPSGERPRGLELFYDQAGNQAIYIITDRRMWAYDHEVEKIYPSTLAWPKHHNNGLGFTMWRDDAAYIANGLAVTRYTRDGVRTDMGMDRDDGIPAERVGPIWGNLQWQNDSRNPYAAPSASITGMIGAQNFIAATVQLGGRTYASGDDQPYAVCVWNEAGWHTLYEERLPYQEGTGAGRFPVGIMVAENVGGYRLWWGEGATEHQGGTADAAYVGVPRLHSLPIPRAFHGPRQKVMDNIASFADSGYFETGWLDAGMRGFEKTWSHLEVYLTAPVPGGDAGGTVSVSYRTNKDQDNWLNLGTASAVGRNVFRFNEDASGFPVGDTSTMIELRLQMHGATPDVTPIIDSYILKFIKLPLPGRAWMMTVPLDSEDYRGIGPQEIDDILSRQTWQGGFSWMLHKDRKYRVRVSQHQAIEGTADVPFKNTTINIIEVPIPGDPVWGGGVSWQS